MEWVAEFLKDVLLFCPHALFLAVDVRRHFLVSRAEHLRAHAQEKVREDCDIDGGLLTLASLGLYTAPPCVRSVILTQTQAQMTGHMFLRQNGRLRDFGATVLYEGSELCRELTGRVNNFIVTRHHWWYKTGMLTVTCDIVVQIGGSILSPTARSRG